MKLLKRSLPVFTGLFCMSLCLSANAAAQRINDDLVNQTDKPLIVTYKLCEDVNNSLICQTSDIQIPARSYSTISYAYTLDDTAVPSLDIKSAKSLDGTYFKDDFGACGSEAGNPSSYLFYVIPETGKLICDQVWG